jgi:hypothetical protein
LRRTTPSAFRLPLSDIDQWAANASDLIAGSSRHSGVSPAPDSPNEDDDDDFDVIRAPNESENGGAKKSTLMDSFRKLSTQFQGRFRGQQKNEDDDDAFLKRSVYEAKNGDTICMWVEAAEVVPCLCSNRRRPAELVTVCDEFISGVKASQLAGKENNTDGAKYRGKDDVCLPEPDNSYDDRRPFYFGLDCRPAEDRVVGRFPKACNALRVWIGAMGNSGGCVA